MVQLIREDYDFTFYLGIVARTGGEGHLVPGISEGGQT